MYVYVVLHHRNGKFNEASAGSIMEPYACGSLIVGIPGGQPSVGRSSADWAASAEPTLPRRLSEWDANSSGRRAGSVALVGLLYSAAVASIILSRCSVSKRSRSTASALAVCNSCDGRDVAGDGTNAAVLPSDESRSRSGISFSASRLRLSELSDGAVPSVPTAADGGFACGISDVNACPGANALGIKPLRIADESERMPKSLARKLCGWLRCISASLVALLEGRSGGCRWSGERDRDLLRLCAVLRSGDLDMWADDELACRGLKLNSNNTTS